MAVTAAEVGSNGKESLKLGGGGVEYCRRWRRSGRRNNDRCVYGNRGGQRRRLSGGQGAEEYKELDNNNITSQLCTDLLPNMMIGFYLRKLL